MTDAPRLVPPPKPVVVAAPPPAPQPGYAPGHVVCSVSHGALWIEIAGGGEAPRITALRLDQAERHLEHVKSCIAKLKGEPARPASDAGRAALAIEGGKP